jgi:hypothetical protein
MDYSLLVFTMKYETKDEKKELLSEPIQHIDIKTFNAIPLIEAFDHMAFIPC